MRKSIVFLYTNKQYKIEVKKNFMIALKICKTVYKKFLREIKEELNKWKDVPYSWMGRFDLVKISTVPKLIYGFTAIPIKISARFFCR